MVRKGNTENVGDALPELTASNPHLSRGEVSSFFTQALYHSLLFIDKIALNKGFGAWKRISSDSTLMIRFPYLSS
jgi:hypothetical protein